MIPYNKPFIAGRELFNIACAVVEHQQTAGGGFYTENCQQWLEQRLDCRKVLLTHSCTAALEMAAILCDIRPGDEIIMPSFTFVSTANAFVLRGGIPVFVDIRPDTMNMDEKQIERAITEQTRAVVPVHYAGVACAMDAILEIAEKNGLYVIEDAAQALLATHKDKFLGTTGDIGALSFHETKNIISGEGGAVLINRPDLIERAEILLEKGTNRKQFFEGRVDKYTWVDIGSSYLPSEVTAGFLWAQLEMADSIVARRNQIFEAYQRLLKPLADSGALRLPGVSPGSACNGHIFYVITASAGERKALMADLSRHGINTVFHYIPLHSSPAGKKYARSSGDLSNTEDLSERLLRLPLFYEMTDEQVRQVVEALYRFYGKR